VSSPPQWCLSVTGHGPRAQGLLPDVPLIDKLLPGKSPLGGGAAPSAAADPGSVAAHGVLAAPEASTVAGAVDAAPHHVAPGSAALAGEAGSPPAPPAGPPPVASAASANVQAEQGGVAYGLNAGPAAAAAAARTTRAAEAEIAAAEAQGAPYVYAGAPPAAMAGAIDPTLNGGGPALGHGSNAHAFSPLGTGAPGLGNPALSPGEQPAPAPPPSQFAAPEAGAGGAHAPLAPPAEPLREDAAPAGAALASPKASGGADGGGSRLAARLSQLSARGEGLLQSMKQGLGGGGSGAPGSSTPERSAGSGARLGAGGRSGDGGGDERRLGRLGGKLDAHFKAASSAMANKLSDLKAGRRRTDGAPPAGWPGACGPPWTLLAVHR